ncbi:MAG: 3-oxoacyl-[acyl-carrier-protein] reductase [candidate division WS1 bacterium]|nr:3-oxoacyl-[acyl-carrier-protein] reductase [candidate division WS1 bacterium]
MPLTGQVALVTGSGRGIGRAIALALAEAGADLVINDVDQASGEATVADLEALGRQAIFQAADVVDEAQVEAMIEAVVAHFGRLDILVNNAGLTRDGLLVRMTEEQWDLVLDVNLKGAFNCTKAAARPMMKARAGRIINIASIAGITGNPGQANYSASKGGLIALTKTSALELARRGINCNAVAPGFIETAMTEQLSEEVRAGWLERIPLGRGGTPEEVAAAVVFLAGRASAYMTGQVLVVDGGMVM